MIGVILIAAILIGYTESKAENSEFYNSLVRLSKALCISHEYVISNILKESGGDPFAFLLNVNRSLDIGVSQINSQAHFGRVTEYLKSSLGQSDPAARACGHNILWDPYYNLTVGLSVLTKCFEDYGYNLIGGIICYGSQTHITEFKALQKNLLSERIKQLKTASEKNPITLQEGCFELYLHHKEVFLRVNYSRCGHLSSYYPKWILKVSTNSPNFYDALKVHPKDKSVLARLSDAPLNLFEKLFPIDKECSNYWNYGYNSWKEIASLNTRPRFPNPNINPSELYRVPRPVIGYYYNNIASNNQCNLSHPKAGVYRWLDLRILSKYPKYLVPFQEYPNQATLSGGSNISLFQNIKSVVSANANIASAPTISEEEKDLVVGRSSSALDKLKKAWRLLF